LGVYKEESQGTKNLIKKDIIGDLKKLRTS